MITLIVTIGALFIGMLILAIITAIFQYNI